VKISTAADWKTMTAHVKRSRGVHDLFVIQAGPEPVDVDWISFR